MKLLAQHVLQKQHHGRLTAMLGQQHGSSPAQQLPEQSTGSNQPERRDDRCAVLACSVCVEEWSCSKLGGCESHNQGKANL